MSNYIIEKVAIDTINLNPSNPRKIIDEQFERLKSSIKRFPKMLELRPLVLNERNQVIGGNMRLLAMIKLGHKEAHVVRAADLTPDEIRQFIILDNVSFGMWDYDMLANTGYEHDELVEMGMPDFDIGTDQLPGGGVDKGKDDAEGTVTAEIDKGRIITITFKSAKQRDEAKEDIEKMLGAYKGAEMKAD